MAWRKEQDILLTNEVHISKSGSLNGDSKLISSSEALSNADFSLSCLFFCVRKISIGLHCVFNMPKCWGMGYEDKYSSLVKP